MIEKIGLPFKKETSEDLGKMMSEGATQQQLKGDRYSANHEEIFCQSVAQNTHIMQKVLEQVVEEQWNQPYDQIAFDLKSLKRDKPEVYEMMARRTPFGEILDGSFVQLAIKTRFCDVVGVNRDNVVWKDLRVSKSYCRQIWFKKIPQKVENPIFSNNQINADFKNILLGLFDNLQLEYNTYWFQGKAKVKIEDYLQPRMIAFQAFVNVRQHGVLMVNPRRVPLLTPDRKKVVAFATYQYIKLVDLRDPRVSPSHDRHWRRDAPSPARKYTHLNWGKIYNQHVHEFKQKYHENPNSFLCFDPQIVFRNMPVAQREEIAYSMGGIFKITKAGPNVVYGPQAFKDIAVEHLETKFNKKLNEFELVNEFANLQDDDKFKTANQGIIKQVADEQGGFQLLKLIKSIPNLKFHLTPEQELMISTPSNLLCLGRSGTGKTTSSALRLFATEAFYKYHDLHRKFKLENPNAKNSEFKVPADFINHRSDVKLLFVSASPVLVNEIKRFFIEFKSHFTTQLEQKSKKIEEQKKPEVKVKQDQSEFENYIQMEIKELEQDEQLEQQQQLAPSMDQLNSDDFPLFLTVKRLLYMIDASLDFPFFARDGQGNMIGMDTNVQWHNESGGVLMINQYYKSTNEIETQLKTLGTKFMDYAAQLETGAADSNKQQEEEHKEDKPKQQSQGGLGDFVDTSQFQYNQSFARTSQNLSFEVDFEVFKLKFWPKVSQQTKLSPLVVWTEIFSEIKGRHDSWQYKYGGIGHELYIRASRSKNTFLQPEERLQIYQIFLQYEKWKQTLCSYDLNDLINHILRQVKESMIKDSQQVHFLMVDEVQDLTQNIITLFMMLAQRNVFFSGDTAQTIAKGVGFRFFDLKQVFTRQNYESKVAFEVPKVLQLAKNFRSHSKILDLANSVVSLLELLFPRTIDKLKKESSDINGPKPILIDYIPEKDALQKLLDKYLVFGSISQKKQDQNDKQQVQFGCTQVVIVRDQESKQSVPEFMKDMLCLTVYEAKGLEFDDVILYNFFKDSKCDSQWNLLSDVVVNQVKTKIKKDADFFDFEMLECQEVQIDTKVDTKAVEGETETTTQLTLKTHHDLVYRKFAQVCTELKLLYVAITRPKNFLVIYDDDASVRKPIADYWVQTGVVDCITRQLANQVELLPKHIRQALRMEDTPEMVANAQHGKHQSEVIKQTWLLQGLKLFKVKYYRAAAQCFHNIGDQTLVQRCKAYEIADQAAILKGQHDQKLAMSLDKKNMCSKAERTQLKNEAKDLLKQFKEQMMQAGRIFEQIDMNHHAAQCFFSAGSIQDSAEMFIKQKKPGPAAECFFKLNQIKKAAHYYSEAKLFTNAFECYERLEDWDALLSCLHKNKDAFSKQEREQLLQKYLPVALNSVYQMYAQMSSAEVEDQVGLSEENKGKIQQMRLKMKFQRSVSVIKEEENADEVDSNEEEESSSSSDNSEKEVKPKSSKQEEIIEQKEEESKIALEEESYEIIDTTQQQQDQSEFSIIESEEQQQHPNNLELKQLELDLLSNIDPDDEFLQSSKSYSLIEDSINSSFSMLKSQNLQSEYSIISGSQLHNVLQQMQQSFIELKDETLDLNSQIDHQHAKVDSLKSSLNLSNYSLIGQQVEFADDIVIQKIIYYVSLFKQEVKSCLDKGKNQDELAKVCDDQDDDYDFMLIDLDEMSKETIQLVVDTLESYEMYRLCIMMYQRFRLTDKIGRFVSAICDKYSNLTSFRLQVCDKFKTDREVELQQKYALIAHEAVQNVLNLVGSVQESNWMEKSFEAFFVQGYWKKLVFMMQSDQSIQLCYVMDDYNSLKMQFLVSQAGLKERQTIEKHISERKLIVELVQEVCKNVTTSELIRLSVDQQQQDSLIESVLDLSKLNKCQCQKISNMLKQVYQQNYCQSCKHPKIGLVWNVDNQAKSTFIEFLQKETKIDLPRCVYTSLKLLLALHKNKNLKHLKLDLLLCALSLYKKSLQPNQLKLRRMVYKAFGITCLQNLDLFSSFSAQYSIISRHSPLFPLVEKLQNLQLIHYKVQKIMQKLIEFSLVDTTGQKFHQNIPLIKQQIKDEFQSMQMKDQLEITGVQVCDLNLQNFLVPQAWIDNILIGKLVNLHNCVIRDSQGLKSKQVYLCQSIIQSLLEISEQKQNLLVQKSDEIQKVMKSSTHQYASSNICSQLYMIIFGTDLQQTLIKLTQNDLEFSIGNEPNQLDEIKRYDVNIQLKPTFQFFQFRDKTTLQYKLSKAINYFKQQTQCRNDLGNTVSYQLFQKFRQLDCTPILRELLRTSPKPVYTKFKHIEYLLNAEKYAKCLNLSECAQQQIHFLKQTFSQLNFNHFQALVVEAFSKAWFSFQIYNSQDGQLTLTAQMADSVSLNLRTQQQGVQELQNIQIANGNTIVVRQALIWVECLLENVSGYEGWREYQHFYELGLQVIYLLMTADLTFEHLCEFWPKLKIIAQASVKKVNQRQEYEQLAESGIKPSAQAKKQMLAIRDEIRKVPSPLSSSAVVFQLADRKGIMNKINSINLQADACLKTSQEILEKLWVDRDTASTKILKIWKRLKEKRKLRLSTFNHESYYLNLSRYLRPLEHGQSTLLAYNQLSALKLKMLQYINSNIPHTTVDSAYLHDWLKRLSATEQEYLKQICVMKFFVKPFSQMIDKVEKERNEFEAWMQMVEKRLESENKVQESAEIERKKFMKREKWDNVIQFHKKKRIMLKHFKANMPK